jgi:hypothetical protein
MENFYTQKTITQKEKILRARLSNNDNWFFYASRCLSVFVAHASNSSGNLSIDYDFGDRVETKSFNFPTFEEALEVANLIFGFKEDKAEEEEED